MYNLEVLEAVFHLIVQIEHQTKKIKFIIINPESNPMQSPIDWLGCSIIIITNHIFFGWLGCSRIAIYHVIGEVRIPMVWFCFFYILNLKITLFSKKTNSQCTNLTLTDWVCKESILTYPKKQQQQTNKHTKIHSKTTH